VFEMTLLCRTNFSKVGNSQAVIIPKKYLDFLNIPMKSKVDLYETPDGIFIKPVREWSAEKQSDIINDILAFVGSPEDDELIPDDFIETYCHEKDDDSIDWESMREA
jgi:antitoxin component of MazEF toxin-antitoxin module